MDKTITSEGRTLFYREEGSGQPVVLLHGFAEDGKLWDPIIPRLKTGYRLLIPDLPGSGRSTLPEGEPSIDALATAVKGLIDAEGIDQCILIGHSMGGYIALSFAAQYPHRLKAFGLFHSTAYADSEEKIAVRRKGIEFIRQHGAAPFVRQFVPNLFAPGTRENRSQLVEELIRRYSGFSPQSLIYYYEAMIRRPDRIDVLQHFTGAILFIIGEKDQAVPYEMSLKQCHEPGIAHIHILENAGHMGMMEEPEDSGDMVESFLNFVYS